VTPRPSGRAAALVGRAAALVGLAALTVTGLAACGSHHHPVADPTTASASTTSSTLPAERHHHRRVHHHTAPPSPLAPLTGLLVPAAVAARSAVVVKIDNISQALPQTGPNQADVVYEELVEGGLTRLAAVFQSQYPDPVGPVRSGRLTDEGIADDLNHPVLAYAGANGLFQPQLAAQPVQDVDDDTNPDMFAVDRSRPAPHNLYTDIAALAGLDTIKAPPAALWAFRRSGSPMRGAGVTPAAALAISFPAASVRWTWDGATHVWLREQDGAVDVDSHGAQLSASNVIVQFIPYEISGHVVGEGAGADGDAIPTGLFVGSGTAWYLSGGAVVKGTWTRASVTARTVYEDSAGDPIRLQPGRTWVELPEEGFPVSVTP
jgi:hypothetical protein